MKTRADIYGQEATELLRLISLYPGLIQCQLAGFFPGKDSAVVCGLLSHLKRQGRAEQSTIVGSEMCIRDSYYQRANGGT